MNTQRKATVKGLMMLAVFVVVLFAMFMPLFNGHNAMEFLDNLYNSISKGSADYGDAVRDEIHGTKSDPFSYTIEMASEEQARQVVLLLNPTGATSSLDGKRIAIEADLKDLLTAAIDDSKIMFQNDGENIKQKYGYNEKKVLHNWWVLFNKIEASFTKEKRFESAKNIKLVQNKVIECSYNYYGIKSQSIKDKYLIVIISLIFYVAYTVWYGFGIMHLFEGWGMKLGH
jgi:hypothetical protein